MTKDEIEILQEEIEHFQNERDKIKGIIGSIGGKTLEKRDKRLNILFIGIIATLFILDVMRHVLKLDVPLPPLFSIEIGLLLVSIKIIWMIHKQMKVEHFQFWILNSIEYRINDVSKKIAKIEKIISNHLTTQSTGPDSPAK